MAETPGRCARAWGVWLSIWPQIIQGLKDLGPVTHHMVEGLAVIATFVVTWHTAFFAFEAIKLVLEFKDAALLGALAAPLTALFGFVGALQTIVLNKYIAARAAVGAK